jgi:hypothetical protein
MLFQVLTERPGSSSPPTPNSALPGPS